MVRKCHSHSFQNGSNKLSTMWSLANEILVNDIKMNLRQSRKPNNRIKDWKENNVPLNYHK